MELLVVEAEPGNARSIITELVSRGHSVATCYDEVTQSPCRSVDQISGCPLLSPKDVAIVVRTEDRPDSLLEMGGVCAERHRVPVMQVDPANTLDLNLRVRVAAAAGRDRTEATIARLVRKAAGDTSVSVVATCSPNRVAVAIEAPDSADQRSRTALADRARAAVRAFDPFVKTIDVSVTLAVTDPSRMEPQRGGPPSTGGATRA